MTEELTVAVVGATGAVGRKMIETLETRRFPVKTLVPMASSRSAGKSVTFRGENVTVLEAQPEAFKGVDIALFSAGAKTSRALSPEAARRGAVVIDNSSAFRMDPEVPLVVPEVNGRAALGHRGIIANPNCSTIQMVVALKPIYDRFGIERIIVSTYQAVSGAGARAVEELMTLTRSQLSGEKRPAEILPVSSLPVHHSIAFNVLPQIDVFEDNGFTKEEMKMVNETRKILDDPEILVSPTCVRVPVVTGHSEAVYVETEEPFELEDIYGVLEHAPGVVVLDDPASQKYPMPADTEGRPEVFVGRIRKDLGHPRGLNLWVVSDNLLKGAAYNAVQIAELLVEQGGLR
ncbi:aspartate-semialdehyde dehydrogenase [Kyrpidia tusciae]|uniref:Aspartate-semialdehyde dehydrogenase n=1 Tax=Kyrpidia tusciae (strain DSM 2912 / NBRC 15312 / T2) TaxID=562970 RepID=D5WPL8_KYRT2|nr:aspartate-semialdehyde dehydrogenase [Kyrpidia tusciae]ADG06277.1 aspartate-semialdehyde dehydrogenase [Kyrpidia tusciae DSM 2912]